VQNGIEQFSAAPDEESLSGWQRCDRKTVFPAEGVPSVILAVVPFEAIVIEKDEGSWRQPVLDRVGSGSLDLDFLGNASGG
jgi:hypothetical protein